MKEVRILDEKGIMALSFPLLDARCKTIRKMIESNIFKKNIRANHFCVSDYMQSIYFRSYINNKHKIVCVTVSNIHTRYELIFCFETE
jgi:hypothetical protein